MKCLRLGLHAEEIWDSELATTDCDIWRVFEKGSYRKKDIEVSAHGREEKGGETKFLQLLALVGGNH